MKKKLLALVLVVVLALTSVIGGTMAYLTDTDDNVNVMTLGNVYIEQNEQQRVEKNGEFTSELEEFEQGKKLMPVTYPEGRAADTVTIGDYAIELSDKEANYVDKIISVTNTGSEPAYVRTLVAVPTGGDAWESDPVQPSDCWLHWNIPSDYATHWDLVSTNVPIIEIDGLNYYVWEFIHKEALAADKTTYPMVRGFYMDKRVDNDEDGFFITYADGTTKRIDAEEEVKIYALTQAVQTAGFTEAQSALDEAFGDVTATSAAAWFNGMKAPVLVSTADELVAALTAGEDVVLTESIEDLAVETTAPYGNKTGLIQNGQAIDGNGNTIDFDSYGDDYGIMTSGGTIKNITLEDVARGIVVMSPTEDIILDNVTLKADLLYPFNTAEHATVDGIDLIVTDSVFGGWTSFAGIESASFSDCEFVVGTYYDSWPYDSLVKPYVNTTFTDCEFANGYYLDLSALGEGCTVTLDGCTVNGQAITAEICGFECDGTEAFCVELPSGRTLADCVIFK